MPTTALNLSDLRFGMWTVVRRAVGNTKHNASRWECVCDCGTTRIVIGPTLRNGTSKNCGCQRAAIAKKTHTKHGHASRQGSSKTYLCWRNMRNRCNNPKNKDFKYYGGRGVSICVRWQKFSNFLEDMGEQPLGLTIERLDNNGNYEKDNCTWATMAQQSLNKTTSIRHAAI